MKYFLFIFIFICLSCSQLEFKTHDKIPTWGQKHQSPSERFVIEGERIFYLWGNYPGQHEVFIDDEIINKGYRMATELSIEEYQTWQNFLWTAFTLGMYVPTNYVIKGKGVQND